MKPITLGILLVICAACQKGGVSHAPKHEAKNDGETLKPSGRVDVPPQVRKQLGLTFAKVERRVIADAGRFAGRFESPPEARRAYHAPVAGRVRLLVVESDQVAKGQPLFGIESPRLRELRRTQAETESLILEATAQLDGLPAFREAHRAHETALLQAIDLWERRVKELETLSQAGGGRAADLAEARASLVTARISLAETQEKDADLSAKERELKARVAGHEVKVALLNLEAASLRDAFPGDPGKKASPSSDAELIAYASAGGVLVHVAISDGAWVEEGSLIVETLDPEALRFHAMIPQADAGWVRSSSLARLAPVDLQAGPAVEGTLKILALADPDARTFKLQVTPKDKVAWAFPGTVGFVEVVRKEARDVLAVPRRALLRDGKMLIFFRRDPKSQDVVIRMNADVGEDDGRFAELASGVSEGDEVVLEGAYQLLLATSAAPSKGGHMHPDGTFHADDDHGGKD